MKNDHFSKIEPCHRFSKNVHFHVHFRVPFLVARFRIFKVRSDCDSHHHHVIMPPKSKMGPTSKSQPTGSKRARKPSSKLADASLLSEDEEVQEDTKQRTKVCRTSWTTSRTEHLLDWLEENPADRQKLFSNSTKDAKDEGRRKRVAKGTKSEFHKMIATHVFSVDENDAVQADFAVNTINYTKSVDNYLGRYVCSVNVHQFILTSFQVAERVSSIQ